MNNGLILVFLMGCAPQWVDVQDETLKIGEDLGVQDSGQIDGESSNIDSDTEVDTEVDIDNNENDSEGDGGSGSTPDESTDNENGSDSDSNDNTDTEPTYVGLYEGTFSGATDYGYGQLVEFCNGDLEIEISSDFTFVGNTICETGMQNWEYSFEGTLTEVYGIMRLYGTMVATDQGGYGYPTDLEGEVFVGDNNTSVYMSLEWEFPEYSIVGTADLEQ